MKTFSTLFVLGGIVPALALGQGKTNDHHLRALGNGRSSVVFFFTAGCPHNPPGVKDVNAFQQMVGKQYGVYGMTNLSQDDAEKYLKKLGAKFRILGDPNGKKIADFGAKHSLDVLVLGADGEVKKFSSGYNRNVLRKIADALPRKGTSDPVVKLDLTKFPKDLESGCGFP